jgi:hypothetical protein
VYPPSFLFCHHRGCVDLVVYSSFSFSHFLILWCLCGMRCGLYLHGCVCSVQCSCVSKRCD